MRVTRVFPFIFVKSDSPQRREVREENQYLIFIGMTIAPELYQCSITVELISLCALCVFAVNNQYLINAEPQVKPPPKASSNSVSPRWIRPSRTAVSRASGTEAPEVLPCSPTVITT